MIARTWIGRTRSEDFESYTQYVQQTGIDALRQTPGNRGAWLLRRLDGSEAEFEVISLWESRESIVAFAGDDLEKAVYYPEDERYLLAMAPQVTHYEMLGELSGSGGGEDD